MNMIDKLPRVEGVSRETEARLGRLVDLVLHWTPHINLVARDQTERIWTRHIVDSLQIYELAPPNFGTWTDLGSGGGFPGLVAAILAHEKNPKAGFSLIESDKRKAAFLALVSSELGLDCKVMDQRAEAALPQNAAVLSARALAPLDKLLALAKVHLASDGVALLHKGRRAEEEIAQARKAWRFSVDRVASRTDREGVILVIRDIHDATDV